MQRGDDTEEALVKRLAGYHADTVLSLSLSLSLCVCVCLCVRKKACD